MTDLERGMRPILTPEQDALCMAALDAAALRLQEEGNTPEAVLAWTTAEADFQRAQLEAISRWPFTYDGGEVPAPGDLIEPLGYPDMRAQVIALCPPELLVGGHLPEVIELAKALDAKVHPANSRMVPQLCRLIERGRSPVAES